jgi:hypothetical protein
LRSLRAARSLDIDESVLGVELVEVVVSVVVP